MKLSGLLPALLATGVIHCLTGSGQLLSAQIDDDKPAIIKNKFNAGLYLGSYFANRHTADLYDGYGYNAEGKKNDFINYIHPERSSFMYQKIILEYGGGYGQTDQVALALGVNHGEWTFDQSDMPLRMKYNPAFTVGIQLNYAVIKRNTFFLNANASRLTLIGNFSIVITNPIIGSQQPGYKNIQTFAITGNEQRLTFQMGYRRMLGSDNVFNLFIEGGPSVNMTKYLANDISINNLHIDLATFYTQPHYPTYRAKYLKGVGPGAFTGFGLDINADQNWNIQVLYSLSYERIAIGENSKFTIQHTAGIRALYTL